MRKILNLLTTLVFWSSLFSFAPVPVYAAACPLDSQATGTSGNVMIFSKTLRQTFTANGTKLSSIDIYLVNKTVGKQIALRIQNSSDATVAGAVPHTFTVGGSGWETFTFDPQVQLTKGQIYKIAPSTNDPTNTARWSYAGNTYTGGNYEDETGPKTNFDFAFQVFACTETTPPSALAGETQTTATSTSTTQSAAAATAPVDPSIKTPILTSIVKNETKTEAPIKKDISFNLNDSLEVFGTSFAGAKVVLFAGDKAFNATVDKDGNWSYKFNQKDLKSGTFTVAGQAQNTEGKGSEKTNLFKLKVNKYQGGSPILNRIDSLFADWNIYYTVIPVGVLLLLLILLVLVARRHQKEDKGKDKKKLREKENNK